MTEQTLKNSSETEKEPDEAAIEHSSACLFDITVECDAAIRSSYAIAERIKEVCVDCEHRKEATKRLNSCLYDVNIECSGGFRYFDISDEERELIKKKVCTKCKDGKCVNMDDVICPKGKYGASNCSDCKLRPLSPAQEFLVREAQRIRESRKARGWAEEPEKRSSGLVERLL